MRKIFWDKRILVTGGNGFLGRYVLKNLIDQQCNVFAPSKAECDLTDEFAAAAMFSSYQPEIVIHLAAAVGGIGKNMRHPGSLFLGNMRMGLNVLELSVASKVEKVVYVGTVCSYPKYCEPPFKESDLFAGYPEETNAPYGIAKRAIGVGLQACKHQYGLDSAYVIPTNLYGPGDNFDPQSSHVIPALIRKFKEANDTGAANVFVWGSGKATRQFLHVSDAANGILSAAQLIKEPDPINLGSGKQYTIRELAHMIKDEIGFKGDVLFGEDLPDGQPVREVSSKKASEDLNWKPLIDFESGLSETIRWFYEQQRSKDAVDE
jgi:GDP-L-fucose synthase